MKRLFSFALAVLLAAPSARGSVGAGLVPARNCWRTQGPPLQIQFTAQALALSGDARYIGRLGRGFFLSFGLFGMIRHMEAANRFDELRASFRKLPWGERWRKGGEGDRIREEMVKVVGEKVPKESQELLEFAIYGYYLVDRVNPEKFNPFQIDPATMADKLSQMLPGIAEQLARNYANSHTSVFWLGFWWGSPLVLWLARKILTRRALRWMEAMREEFASYMVLIGRLTSRDDKSIGKLLAWAGHDALDIVVKLHGESNARKLRFLGPVNFFGLLGMNGGLTQGPPAANGGGKIPWRAQPDGWHGWSVQMSQQFFSDARTQISRLGEIQTQLNKIQARLPHPETLGVYSRGTPGHYHMHSADGMRFHFTLDLENKCVTLLAFPPKGKTTSSHRHGKATDPEYYEDVLALKDKLQHETDKGEVARLAALLFEAPAAKAEPAFSLEDEARSLRFGVALFENFLQANTPFEEAASFINPKSTLKKDYTVWMDLISRFEDQHQIPDEVLTDWIGGREILPLQERTLKLLLNQWKVTWDSAQAHLMDLVDIELAKSSPDFKSMRGLCQNINSSSLRGYIKAKYEVWAYKVIEEAGQDRQRAARGLVRAAFNIMSKGGVESESVERLVSPAPAETVAPSAPSKPAVVEPEVVSELAAEHAEAATPSAIPPVQPVHVTSPDWIRRRVRTALINFIRNPHSRWHPTEPMLTEETETTVINMLTMRHLSGTERLTNLRGIFQNCPNDELKRLSSSLRNAVNPRAGGESKEFENAWRLAGKNLWYAPREAIGRQVMGDHFLTEVQIRTAGEETLKALEFNETSNVLELGQGRILSGPASLAGSAAYVVPPRERPADQFQDKLQQIREKMRDHLEAVDYPDLLDLSNRTGFLDAWAYFMIRHSKYLPLSGGRLTLGEKPLDDPGTRAELDNYTGEEGRFTHLIAIDEAGTPAVEDMGYRRALEGTDFFWLERMLEYAEPTGAKLLLSVADVANLEDNPATSEIFEKLEGVIKMMGFEIIHPPNENDNYVKVATPGSLGVKRGRLYEIKKVDDEESREEGIYRRGAPVPDRRLDSAS
jgi:hypothetical protein